MDAMILGMMAGDPRLRTLPAAARCVWLDLVQAMRAASVSVLRFGSVSLSRKEIAMLVANSESELEANLRPLLDRGLLVEEADGAIGAPMLVAAVARSEINRLNGLKGGATRRRQAEERRQGHMALPIAGGADGSAGAVAGSKPEANAVSVSPAIAKLSEAEKESSAKPCTPVGFDVMQRVGDQVLEIAGINPVSFTGHFGLVRTWMGLGADERLIVETVRTVMARGSARPAGIQYFDKAVREALAARAVPVSRYPGWAEDTEAWRAGGCVGPMPALADYAAEVAA